MLVILIVLMTSIISQKDKSENGRFKKTVFVKSLVLDVWQCFEYAFVIAIMMLSMMSINNSNNQ